MPDLISLILAALDEEVKEMEALHKEEGSALTAAQVLEAHILKKRIKRAIEENTPVVGKTLVQVDIPAFTRWQKKAQMADIPLEEKDLPVMVMGLYESVLWGDCYQLLKWGTFFFTCPARFCTIIKEENS